MLYKDALCKDAALHMVEKHRDIGPITIDLDFRQSQSVRIYTKQHVKDILYELMKVVDEYVIFMNMIHTDTKLFVLEKGTAPRTADKNNSQFTSSFPRW